MSKVCVIMSTFNGELFIENQIKSIFDQNIENLTLYIRDDGSIDNTIKIINKLSKVYPIELVTGTENLKPAKSFLQALKECNVEADFYAYCDQDDVWYNDKLSRACKELYKLDSEELNLYCSSYDVVDKDLNLIFKRDLSIYGDLTLFKTILGICPSGCTMVFNKKLKQKISNSKPKNFRMHDFWTLLTVQVLNGNLIVDNYSSMAYRQHGNNSVGFSKRISLKHLISLILTIKEKRNMRKEEVESLIECYGKDISPDYMDVLVKVKNYNKSFKNRLLLMREKNFSISDRYRKIMFKLAVLFGVF